MSELASNTVLDLFLDPIANCLTPEVAKRIVDLHTDPVTQERIDALAAKANEGQLSALERTEYEEIVDGIDLVAILKAKARKILSTHAS